LSGFPFACEFGLGRKEKIPPTPANESFAGFILDPHGMIPQQSTARIEQYHSSRQLSK